MAICPTSSTHPGCREFQVVSPEFWPPVGRSVHVGLCCQGEMQPHQGKVECLLKGGPEAGEACQTGCSDLFCHPHLGLNSTIGGVKYLLSRRRDRSAALACQSRLLMHCGDNWSDL